MKAIYSMALFLTVVIFSAWKLGIRIEEEEEKARQQQQQMLNQQFQR